MLLERLFRIGGAALLCICLAGCAGVQSALDPKGPEARELSHLIWFFIIVCGFVWLLVMLALLFALSRRKRPEARAGDPLVTDPVHERRLSTVIGVFVALTAIVLVVFTLSSYLATRGLASAGGDPLRITITGKQWWWEVKYEDPRPTQIFETANELHVPTGRAVKLTLISADVIHSFWMPNLSGKQDLIPGQENELSFTVSEPGIYRGQCAEFCGLQHAKMALLLVAERPDAFEKWREAQLASAAPVADPVLMKGRDVFEGRGCFLCHTIQGTTAHGSFGPDLTHIGSRATLAAGVLPNTTGNLAGWIANPQSIKPGCYMPRVPLSGDELTAVSAYLESLK